MNHPVRVILVTTGLTVAGAVFGGLAAVIALAIALAVTPNPFFFFFEPVAYVLVGAIGAFLGGVLLPSACWVLLRCVPLGLAVLGTVIGTVAGGALGWVLPIGPDMVSRAMLGAIAGFAAAALFLRLRFSAPRVPRGAAA